jgi:hypothetical protein
MSEEDKIYEYLVANSKIKRTPKAIMTEEEFKTKYKYRSWEWPKIGDKVKLKHSLECSTHTSPTLFNSPKTT